MIEQHSETILRELTEADIAFIVVGGLAAVLQNAPMRLGTLLLALGVAGKLAPVAKNVVVITARLAG